jgi:hypothetical protein
MNATPIKTLTTKQTLAVTQRGRWRGGWKEGPLFGFELAAFGMWLGR